MLALSLISDNSTEAKTELSGLTVKHTAAGKTTGEPEKFAPLMDAVKPIPAVPVPTPLPLTEKDAIKSDLYMDAFNVLKDDNKCSRFFGGSVHAVHVLNQLTSKMRKEPLDNSLVGFKMSGNHINISNRVTGAAYRMFDSAIANSRGPIYNRSPRDAEARRAVGRFPIHTRGARTLMLLHELGHLIAGKDGNWLLPNDGGNQGLSLKNTYTVEFHCAERIRSLKD